MKILGRYEFWITLVVIVGGVLGFLTLPEKVDTIETKVEENTKDIVDVGHTFDMYMMEQRTIQKEQNKREELMLELLKEK